MLDFRPSSQHRGAKHWLLAASLLFTLLAPPVQSAIAQNSDKTAVAANPATEGDFGATPFRIDLKPPGRRDFVLDEANLLSEADKQKIKQIGNKLLTDKAAPLVVVTIDSMAKHGGAGMRIETFAQLLFDQWQIGPARLGQHPWNYGILLLVSKGNRKARIELGAGWRHDQDVLASQIMDDQIIPRFKQGDFSGGIMAGVEALDKMARGLQLPSRPAPPRSHAGDIVGLVLVGLAIFTVVSLIRRGSSGWAWIFWALIFSVIGTVLYQVATSRSNGGFGSSGGGGGFSGGSFGGGGFSGGGGASGSW